MSFKLSRCTILIQETGIKHDVNGQQAVATASVTWCVNCLFVSRCIPVSYVSINYFQFLIKYKITNFMTYVLLIDVLQFQSNCFYSKYILFYSVTNVNVRTIFTCLQPLSWSKDSYLGLVKLYILVRTGALYLLFISVDQFQFGDFTKNRYLINMLHINFRVPFFFLRLLNNSLLRRILVLVINLRPLSVNVTRHVKNVYKNISLSLRSSWGVVRLYIQSCQIYS